MRHRPRTGWYDVNALMRQALTLPALKAALDKVYGNRGCPGVDGQSVFDFASRGDFALRSLAGDVQAGRYVPQPLLRIWIPRPAGKAPRGLGVPTVRDRVLQTAVAEVLVPLAEHPAEDASYAYRRGRGHHLAVAHVERLVREGWRWIVEADIQTFFDEIDHTRLEALLTTVLPDEPRLRGLIGLWLRVPFSDNGALVPRTQGVPQGSPISPMLSNLYLDELDEALLDANHRLIPFADDFVVLARSQERANEALELTRDTLERLALRLNPAKTRVVHSDDGFDFLGWNFVRTLAWPKARLAEQSGPALLGSVTEAPAHALDPPASLPASHRDEASIQPAPPATTGAEDAVLAEITPASDDAAADDLNGNWEDLPANESLDLNAAGQEDGQGDSDEPALPALAPLQRTLYLVDETVRLEVDNQRLVVQRDGRPVLAVSVLNVDHVVVFGPVQVSTQALQLVARAGATVAFLSRLGRFYGRFESADGSALGLLQAQFRQAEAPGFALAISRRLIAAKLRNSATVLARTLRRHPADGTARRQDVAQAPARLREWADGAERASDLPSLRGIEGAAAALHFQTLQALLPAGWGFERRVPRPAPDAVNALLSFGYSLLYQCMAGLIRGRGLHAHLGLLHASGGAHMALASDLMEPYRAYAVDATVLRVLFSGELTPDTCGAVEDGVFRLSRDAQRLFIRQLETRFNAPQLHSRTREPMDFKRMADADVRQFAQAVREGRAAEFWPAVWD